MKRLFLFPIMIMVGIICLAALASDVFAFSSNPISVSVKPNSKVHLRNFYMYTLGPCRAYPAPVITSEGAKLGKISISKSMKKMKPNPCDADFEYEVSSAYYEAGPNTGKDEFTLFIHDVARFHHVKTTVLISGSPHKALDKNIGNPLPKIEEKTKTNKISIDRKSSMLLVTLRSNEEVCKGFNETFHFDVLNNTISKQKAVISSKEWTADGRLEKEKISILLSTSSDQLSLIGSGEQQKYNGRWINAKCNGSFTAIVVE